MPILTITEAARLAGVDRRTLQRQIKRGVVSTVTQPDGSRGVDASELSRVYPDMGAAAPQGEARQAPQTATGHYAAILEAQLQAVQAQLRQAQDTIAAADEREEWYRRRIESLEQRLLPAPKRGWVERLAELIERLRRRE